jgi:hypothetical protein
VILSYKTKKYVLSIIIIPNSIKYELRKSKKSAAPIVDNIIVAPKQHEGADPSN